MLKTYLALGDSYTIGEQVLPVDSFPYQTVQLLRKTEMEIAAPEIIAKTGWTTDELKSAIAENTFLSSYDLVTLLIGVNDQYRGRTVEEYKPAFEELLQKAIFFAGDKSNHVFVLSVPDWGVTPFAASTPQGGKERNLRNISEEITAFNAAAAAITQRYHCHFIDITAAQRRDGNRPGMLASDGLHPSGAEYAKWAEKLAVLIISLHSA